MDLTTQTPEQLTALRASIDGELARRAGEGLCVRAGEWEREIPKGGALLKERPAIGGDSNTDYWYPSLDAANAALRARFAEYRLAARDDGGLSVDFTAPGCCDSTAWTRPN